MTWQVFVSGGPEQPAGTAAPPPPQPPMEGPVFVRSTLPGTGLGHVWHKAGDIVEMSVEDATELVAIEPTRFTAYHEHPDDKPKPPAKKTAAPRTKVTEPDPNA